MLLVVRLDCHFQGIFEKRTHTGSLRQEYTKITSKYHNDQLQVIQKTTGRDKYQRAQLSMPTKSAFRCKTCREIRSEVRTKPMVLDYTFEEFAMRHVHFILSIKQYTDLLVNIFLDTGLHVYGQRNRKSFRKSLVLRRCFRECLLSTYTYTYKELGARYIHHNCLRRTGNQLSPSRDHLD